MKDGKDSERQKVIHKIFRSISSDSFETRQMFSRFFSDCPLVMPLHTQWGAHRAKRTCLTRIMCVLRCSVVSDSASPWTIAQQAPLSLGFCQQEYWSGVPLPPPGDLPNPGIQPVSPTYPALAGRFFTTSATWEAQPESYLWNLASQDFNILSEWPWTCFQRLQWSSEAWTTAGIWKQLGQAGWKCAMCVKAPVDSELGVGREWESMSQLA